MAQSVEQPTLDFSSGHVLRVLKKKKRIWGQVTGQPELSIGYFQKAYLEDKRELQLWRK